MGIILKHLFKNIFGKPGRTLLVLFCITLCSFVAIFSFDLTSSMENVLGNAMSQLIGSSDIMVSSDKNIDIDEENLPKLEYVEIYDTSNQVYKHSDRAYYMVDSSMIVIQSFDLEKASKLGFGNGTTEITNGQCLISEEYKTQMNVDVGDTIILYDKNDEPHSFEVAGMAIDLSKILTIDQTILVTKDDIQMLSCGNCEIMTLIDVENNSEAKEVEEYLKDKYPDYEVMYFLGDDELKDELASMTKVFTLILAICILMVIFVTISVSERIICERMAVIGTLRSLGFSRNVTTAILLSENAMYGLIGSLIGVGIYAAIRTPIFNMLFVLDASEIGVDVDVIYGSINYFVVFAIVILAVVVECLCSLKEVLKAVKTSIRDIIFSNKDTKYEINKIGVCIGLVSMVLSLVLMFLLKGNYLAQIASIVFMMAGISMVSPCIFVFIGKHLSDFFEKKGKIIPALAARESYTKKNTIGASILISTVVALCIVVISFGASIIEDNKSGVSFTSDIEIQTFGEKESSLRYLKSLEGVTEVVYTYDSYDTVLLNGKEVDLRVYRAGTEENSYKYDKKLSEVPMDVAEDEIYVSAYVAKKYNLKEGNTYSVTLRSDDFLPFEYEMKVAGIVENGQSFILIGSELYDNIYSQNRVSYAYICCDNPTEIDSFIEKHSNGICRTIDEAVEQNNQDNSSTINMTNAILIVGCAVTFIGASGSLLIGFEARKRECAVLLATSLTRKKLSFSFLLESFFASFWGILFAIPFGFLLTVPVINVFDALDTYMVLKYDIPRTIMILVIMLLAFSLMAIQPISALRKMKLSEQLKYE